MKIRATKGIGKIWFTAWRDDETEVSWNWHIEGRLPHDLIHYAMEKSFGIQEGFWGLIAKGVDWKKLYGAGLLQRADAFVKSEGGSNGDGIIQAEALAGAMGIERNWGEFNPQRFVEYVITALDKVHIPLPPTLTIERAIEAEKNVSELEAKWQLLKEKEGLDLEW
jgi:hypothetical protein